MAGTHKIEVTQEDIDRAVANTSTHCAVAEAIMRCVPHSAYVMVDAQTIRWTNPETEQRFYYLTPAKVQDYVIAFDAGDDIKPMTFTLGHPAFTRTAKKKTAGRERGTLHIHHAVASDVHATKTTDIPNVPIPSNLRRRTQARRYGQRVMRANAERVV